MSQDAGVPEAAAPRKSFRTPVFIPSCDKEACETAVDIINQQERKNNPMEMASRAVRCVDNTEPTKSDEAPRTCADAIFDNMRRYLPITVWLPALRNRSFKDVLTSDIVAGLTVGVVAIPQSMSYANIAGMQYHHGLYSAALTPLIYVLFGQSRQLAVGPVAIVSLLVEAGLNGLLTEEECPAFFHDNPDGKGQNELCPDQYARLVFLCSLLVAVMQLASRFLRLGFLVSFLAHPVISGFTTGAAMIIMLSQAKYIVGFSIPKSQYVYKTVAHIVMHLGETKPLNCFLGLLCFVILVAAKVASKKWKKVWWLKSTSPLFVCVMGILLLSSMPSLKEDHYIKNVGDVPQGLPPLSVDWNFDAFGRVFPSSITIALIAYMESIAISKALASQHSYDIDAGQELLALGLTNLIGSAFSCYPCSGSFCRSSVNNGMGAKTGLSSLVNGSILVLTLLFLAPAFYYLPKFVLGAIVMNAVTGLIESGMKDAFKIYKIRKLDFALWLAAWVGTLFLGVLLGIGIAVVLSLAIVIYETVRPQFTVLWRLPGTSIYRSVKQDSGGAFIPGVFIVRIGSSMYFANSTYVKDTLFQFVNNLTKVEPIKYVIIEMTSVTSVDSTAAHALEEVILDFRHRGIQVVLTMVSNGVEKTLRAAHVMKVLGEDWVFPSVHVAVQACLKHKHALTSAGGATGRDNASVGPEDNSSQPSTQEPFIVVGDEVDVSNDMHNAYTTVHISTRFSGPRMLSDLTTIFMKHDIVTVRAEVDVCTRNATSMCFWLAIQRPGGQKQEFAKLSGERMQLISDDINAWLEQMSSTQEQTSSFPGSGDSSNSGQSQVGTSDPDIIYVSV